MTFVKNQFHIFLQNFIFRNTNQSNYTDLDGGRPWYSIQSCGERKKFTAFGAAQIVLSLLIFFVTFSENENKPVSTHGIQKVSDEFTLWTNTLLFINGAINLIFGEKTRVNILNHQLQAALIPSTICLGGGILISTHLLGTTPDPKRKLVPWILVAQHGPSALVALTASLTHSYKTSEIFKQPSALYFLIRLAYAAQYIARDALYHYSGYSGFGFESPDGKFNPVEFAFLLSCFAIQVLFSNLFVYNFSVVAEKTVSCFASGMKLCCLNLFSSKNEGISSAIPMQNSRTGQPVGNDAAELGINVTF